MYDSKNSDNNNSCYIYIVIIACDNFVDFNLDLLMSRTGSLEGNV